VTVDATQAYLECERITWSQARNFAYGIRLLPPPKRRALAAIYAFARRIDDIGDGDLPAADKATALEAARAQTSSLAAAVDNSKKAEDADLDPEDPVLVALVDAGTRFPIPLAAFGELIDGCLADVNQATYATFDDLLWYCRCVAGSIGRLSLGVYRGERGVVPPEQQSVYRGERGVVPPEQQSVYRGERGVVPEQQDPASQSRMADELGVALQLTNILRDVREDYLNGRVYLPAEDLAKFGCELPLGQPEPFQTDAQRARFASLVEFEAARAREWYASGMRLLVTIDRRSAACTGAMAGIYRRLLERIARHPSAVLQGRMSLPAWEKALVAAQALTGIDRWRISAGSRGGDPPQTPASGASSATRQGEPA
jgi:phytoene/squalene synthetase